jgi:hypothetical protein
MTRSTVLPFMGALAMLSMGIFGMLFGFDSWGGLGGAAGFVLGAGLAIALTWVFGVSILAFRYFILRKHYFDSRGNESAAAYGLCAVIALAVVGIIRQLGY